MRRCLTLPGPPYQLNVEHSLSWSEPLPDGVELAALPDLMERLHFRAVAAFGFGGIRLRPESDRIVCALPGGIPGLVFERPGDELTDRRAARWWRMGGWLMRPGEDARFGLGIELRDGGVRAWVRTERFGSLFLSPVVPARARRLYGSYHAHVSFAYLEGLRRQLAR